MKLLFISQNFPYPPYSDGARLKTYNLIKYLSKYNKIFLITFCSEQEKSFIREIKPFCENIVTVSLDDIYSGGKVGKIISNLINPRRFDSAKMSSEIMSAAEKWSPDIVHVDLPMMSPYWKDIKKFPKVIASHDTISLFAYKNYKSSSKLFKKAMWYLLYKQRQWVERTYYPHYGACTLVSEEDKTFLKKHCQDLRVEVIPSGVDIEYFKQGELNTGSSRQPAVGFFGSVDFLPNVDAVIYFVSEIYPMIKKAIPDVIFFIVGRNPTDQIKSFADNNNIFVTGEVDDIREYYQKVSVVVAPTRLGSGIKNTVLQAMSMSKPVVATSQAVKAIDVEDGVHLMIADESNKFAEKVIALLKAPDSRKTLGDGARDLVVRKYSWESHANAFQSLYESILEKRSYSKYACTT